MLMATPMIQIRLVAQLLPSQQIDRLQRAAKERTANAAAAAAAAVELEN